MSDFVTPHLLLDVDQATLAVGVATDYVDPTGSTIPNLLAAGALLYALPVVVLFIILQRFLVQGIADVARLRTTWFEDPWGVVFILVEKSRPERPYYAQWSR